MLQELSLILRAKSVLLLVLVGQAETGRKFLQVLGSQIV
jgi:hypothetical protein